MCVCIHIYIYICIYRYPYLHIAGNPCLPDLHATPIFKTPDLRKARRSGPLLTREKKNNLLWGAFGKTTDNGNNNRNNNKSLTIKFVTSRLSFGSRPLTHSGHLYTIHTTRSPALLQNEGIRRRPPAPAAARLGHAPEQQGH